MSAVLGARRGEVVALQWEDIDLAAAVVRLRPPEVRRVVELKQSMIVKVGTRRQPLYVVRRREEGPTCELICE